MPSIKRALAPTFQVILSPPYEELSAKGGSIVQPLNAARRIRFYKAPDQACVMAVSFPVLSLVRQHQRVRTDTGYRFLAKHEAAAVGRQACAAQREKSPTAERRDVPLDEEPARHENSEVSAEASPADKENRPNMQDVFGPGGLLERSMIGGYEHRRAQLLMAELVQDAFESRHHLVVEAGTGTGKTLAYLLPAICSGRRVVISTATKSLQEQLYQKDIPFLQKHFAPELKVAVMKGRSNFLCRAKLHQITDQPILKGIEEMDAFRQIQDWSKLTETGDRAELTFLPDDSELWTRIDARRDTCTGQKCPEFKQCFITAMQQRAKEADLIIVNHHLFFADLALKQDDFGSILPEYSAVVFDEAHEMEDVASDYFGRQISNYRFEELARDADIAMRLLHLATPSLLRRTQRIRERSRAFFDAFPARDGRYPFERNERAAFLEQQRETYDALANALKGLETEFAAMTQKPEELLRIARRSFEIRQELSFLLESHERNFVYWYERRSKGVFLAATPIDVRQVLRARLFEQFDSIVLTSATLTVAGRFEFIRQRLGLDHAKEGALPPEFDWAKQALLYLPRAIPDVRHPTFSQAAADEIVKLLEISQGRAFCLFTSHSQMNDLFELVAARVKALQEDGRNAFSEFQVPQAVLALKQGFGRLVRTKTDRGVLALLDSRIQRMAYGKIFLESLPGYSTTQELRDVAKFLESGKSKGPAATEE